LTHFFGCNFEWQIKDLVSHRCHVPKHLRLISTVGSARSDSAPEK
jgi:hypothetical protein